MEYSAKKYALPQIEIVSPLVVVCLGTPRSPMFRALRKCAKQQSDCTFFSYAGATVVSVIHTGQAMSWKGGRKNPEIKKQWASASESLALRMAETDRELKPTVRPFPRWGVQRKLPPPPEPTPKIRHRIPRQEIRLEQDLDKENTQVSLLAAKRTKPEITQDIILDNPGQPPEKIIKIMMAHPEMLTGKGLTEQRARAYFNAAMNSINTKHSSSPSKQPTRVIR